MRAHAVAASGSARAAALDRFQQQGFLLLEATLDAGEMSWARAAIDRLRPQHWDYTGLVDHYKCIFNREPGWLRYLDCGGVIELMETLLGADCHIIGQTAWRFHPGFIGGETHVDYLPFPVEEPLLTSGLVSVPPQIVTVHFFLDHIDETLAPTQVIAGSHRAGRAPQPGETSWRGEPLTPVLCRAGDALLFRSDLWHAGSRNRSERSRYLLQVHYGRRMVAQKFSPYLDWRFNPAVIAAATPRQRRLLGEHSAAEYD
jgi:ectoine hydroxylase-related dioxygenase (phytanoyl-CoA dioxygenase family)